MKAKRENEELVRLTVRIPAQIKKALDDMAIAERHSINDQLIVLLEQFFSEGEET